LTKFLHSADKLIAERCFAGYVMFDFRNKTIFFKDSSHRCEVAVSCFFITVETVPDLSGSGKFLFGIGTEGVVEFYDALFPSCC
jgi:hypothetical protein